MEATARKTGWVTLAGVLFLLVGAWNFIIGLIAVGVSLGGTDATVRGDLDAGNLEGLGIAVMIIGILVLIAGAGILARNAGAWLLGMVLAVISLLVNFSYHKVLDGWGFIEIAVTLAVIVILALRRPEFG
jgi:hypothetical protein